MTDRDRTADAATLREAAVILRSYPAETAEIGIDDGGEFTATILVEVAAEVEG